MVQINLNFGIKLYLKDLLVESIKKSDCYIVSSDESLNKETQNCEMDLLFQYFNSSDDRVKVRFYDSWACYSFWFDAAVQSCYQRFES